MTTLIGIPATQLPDCWENIKYLVGDACSRSNGKYEAVDILRSLLRGDMQLWAAVSEDKIEGIAIGEIVNYPQIRIYRMLAATGHEMNNWVHHVEGIKNWARLQGCKKFEAVTRPGWERVLKDFKKTHVVLECPLEAPVTLQ